MRRSLLAMSALCGLFFGTGAYAADAEMLTASEGGAYNRQLCPAIAQKLAAAGYNLKCTPSAGSGQNFDDVLSGKAVLALGQTDVSGLKLIEDAAKGGNAAEAIGLVGFIVPEGLFCVAKTGGRVATANAWNGLNDSEKPDKLYAISTQGEKSGTVGTLNFLRKSFPNFGKNTELKPQDAFKFDVELGRLRTGLRDMVCFVAMPNPEDEKIQTVMASNDLFFVPFDSPMLATIQINGRPAYQIMDAPLTGGFIGLAGKKLKTIHTGVTVYMNVDKIDEKLYKAVVAALRTPDLLPKGNLATLASWSDSMMGASKDLYYSVVKK